MNEPATVRLNRFDFPAAARTEAPASEVQLIYIHGLGGSCGNWYFNYLLPWRGRFRQIAYDMRGHGDTHCPQTGYTTRHHADDLHALVNEVGGVSTRRCFIGYSYGGCVALEYAVRYAKAGDRVVLLDSPPVSRIDAHVVAELAGLKAAMRGEAAAAKGHLATEFTAAMGGSTQSSRTIARYAHRLERLLGTRFSVEAVDDHVPPPSALAAMASPLLMVYAGRGDSLDHAEHLKAHVPDARLVTLDAGHDLISTHAEDIRALVLEFLHA